MEWRIIETAPWGAEVLIYSEGDMAVAWRDSDNDGVWTMTDYHDNIQARAFRRHMAYPTHWMPLPEAPKP